MKKILLVIILLSGSGASADSFSIGKWTRDTYLNDFFNLKLIKKSNWKVATHEEIGVIKHTGRNVFNKIMNGEIIKEYEIRQIPLIYVYKQGDGKFAPNFFLMAYNKNRLTIKKSNEFLINMVNSMIKEGAPVKITKPISVLNINGKEYFSMAIQVDMNENKYETIKLATESNGYVLMFNYSYINSNDKKDLIAIMNTVMLN